MSAEDYEIFNTLSRVRKHLKNVHGLPCPECQRLLPRTNPKILLPGQRCKMHKWTDPRPHLTNQQLNDIYAGFGVKRVTYADAKETK